MALSFHPSRIIRANAEQFAAGGNDRALCTNFREGALKALPRGDTLGECEPVVVRRVS